MVDSSHASPLRTTHVGGPWRWTAWPLWMQGLAFGVAHVTLAALSYAVEARPAAMVTMWLPAGLYVGTLLRAEPRHWFLFVAVALPANLGFDLWTGKAISTGLLLYAANTFEAATGAWLIRRFVTRHMESPTEREVGLALLASPVVATFIGSAFGATVTLGPEAFPRQWFGWWIGDAVGILLVAPLVLTCGEAPVGFDESSPRRGRIERLVFAAVLAAWSVFVFRDEWHPGVALKFTLLPFAMMAGVRFGIQMAGLTCLGIALLASWFTMRGESDVAMAGLAPAAKVIALQVYLAVLTVPALFAAAFLAKHRRAALARRQANDKLELAEAQYRTILKTSMDGYLLLNPEGAILDVNAAAARMSGYGRDELLAMRVTDVVVPTAPGAFADRVRRIVELGSDRFEVRLRRKDGLVRDVDVSTRYLADLGLIFAFLNDITERKRTERELAAIYDHAPVMMCVLDDQRRVRYANRSFEAFVGSPAGALTTLPACGVIGCVNAGDDPGSCGAGKNCTGCGLRLALEDSLRTGASHTGIDYQTTMLLNDRPRNVALLGSTTRIDTTREMLLLLCLVDVTREKQAEADVRASRDRLRTLSRRLVTLRDEAGRELARELHDRVGQNLTALNLNFSRLQDALAGSQDRRITAPLQDSFTLVAETMGHVRDVMSGLRPPVLEDYGLPAALRWYAGQFARRTGLAITVKADDAERPGGDIENALFRIVQEALTNVARHASAKSVLVTLKQDDGALSLEITDDGVGFDPSEREGVGRWGLMMMRERAEDAAGHCSVVSAHGRGTTVRINIPRQPGDAEQETDAHHNRTGGRPRGGA